MKIIITKKSKDVVGKVIDVVKGQRVFIVLNGIVYFLEPSGNVWAYPTAMERKRLCKAHRDIVEKYL